MKRGPDIRFFVELVERANDRLLNGIRAFNAIAYMLLGPLLAIAAFVDYHDLRNMVPLSLVAFSTAMAFATLCSGDGTPIPNPAKDDLFERYAADAEGSLRNAIDDLRHWTPRNNEAHERKQRALLWAS